MVAGAARTAALNASAKDDRSHRLFLLSLLGLGASMLWLRPIAASLWLDEGVTYWVIKDGWAETFKRSLEFQSVSPLYFLVARLVTSIGGAGEVILRLPSVVAAAVACGLLFRLGKRLGDGEMALLAVLFFATSGTVAFLAIDARPYALGLLFVVAAVLALVRWHEEGRWRDGVSYVVLAALTVYVHPMFGTMFAVHAIYALTARRHPALRWWHAAVALAGIGVLLLPFAAHLLEIAGRRHLLSMGMVPGWWSVRLFALPVGVVCAAWAARRWFPARVVLLPVPVPFLSAWSLGAPLSLALAAWFTSTKIFAPRYLACAAPGFALLLAWLVRAFRGARTRRLIAAAWVCLALLLFGRADHGSDWRSAAAAVRALGIGPETPVLVRSGFIEAASAAWLRDRERQAYLLAPLAYYPAPGRLIPLPYDLDGTTSAYMEDVAGMLASGPDRFVVLAERYAVGHREILIREWLHARLSGAGFVEQDVARFGRLHVDLFERRSRVR